MDSSREEGIVAGVSVDDSRTEINKDNPEALSKEQEIEETSDSNHKTEASTANGEERVKTEQAKDLSERVEEVALKENEGKLNEEDKESRRSKEGDDKPGLAGVDQPSPESGDKPKEDTADDEPSQEDTDQPSDGDKDKPSQESEDKPSGEDVIRQSRDTDKPSTEDANEGDKDNLSRESEGRPSGDNEDKLGAGDYAEKMGGTNDTSSTEDADQPGREDADVVTKDNDEKPGVEDVELSHGKDNEKPSVEDADQPTDEDGDKKSGANKMDILGNGQLVKELLKAGNGIASRPTRGQLVTLKCVGYLDEKNEKFEEFESLQFELAEGEVIQALDLGVSLMELGEQCILTTDAKYAYGDLGREPDVPGGARLRFELELTKVEEAPNILLMDTKEKVKRANKRRERGNELYLRGEYSSAINSYSRALTILEDDELGANKEEYKTVEELKMKCYNNLAACQLKVEAFDAALKSCNIVLKVEPNNVKALFRKGKVLANKGELEDAISEMRKAIKIEPVNKIIHQELAKLVAKYNEQMQSTKEMCKKMVGDMADVANTKTEGKGTSKFSASKLLLGAAAVAIGAVVTSIVLAMKTY